MDENGNQGGSVRRNFVAQTDGPRIHARVYSGVAYPTPQESFPNPLSIEFPAEAGHGVVLPSLAAHLPS